MFFHLQSFVFGYFAIVMAVLAPVLSLPTSSPSDTVQARAGMSGHATWFNVGLGSCGQTSHDTDMIVALASPTYASGSHCGKTVRITSSDGSTADATVLDTCPGCSAGDLDMSPALFQKFFDLGKGVFDITWEFV